MNTETYSPAEENELEGFTRVRRQGWGQERDPMREAALASAAQFLADAMNSRVPAYALKEALAPTSKHVLRQIDENYPYMIRETYTVSDFPNLLGDVLDRMMLDNFRLMPSAWRAWCRVPRPLRDFRTVRRLALNGAEGQYQTVNDDNELEYSTTLSEDNYTYNPSLRALGVKLSFRAIMDDDLNAFDSIPQRLGRGGARTVARFATDLLFDSSGPDATLISSGNGNLLTANPIFNVANLGVAFETLLGFTDADSEPILVEGVHLLYGPGLHVTVQNVLNQLTVDVVEAGGTSNRTVRVNNWIVRNLNPVMDPYIPIIATTNGDTSWMLIADPGAGRPIAEIGFLAGFEEPQLFVKAGNTQGVTGGINQSLGDFETMASHYKGVIAFGGATLEPQSAVGSDGSGS